MLQSEDQTRIFSDPSALQTTRKILAFLTNLSKIGRSKCVLKRLGPFSSKDPLTIAQISCAACWERTGIAFKYPNSKKISELAPDALMDLVLISVNIDLDQTKI